MGDVSVVPNVIDGSVKKKMQKALKDIQSGKICQKLDCGICGRFTELQKIAEGRRKAFDRKDG